jgi:hydrogenase expression/formation protein HypE
LAVNGTVNDLAACGARPLVISLALILEEGFWLESLERIVRSIQEAANKAGVKIVTGDTKVVERGKGDGCYINTSGIGIVNENAVSLGPSKILAEDEILITGPIGDHGTTIMLARGDLGITADISSDTASLADPIAAVMEQCGKAVHAMRDPTRGGLATVLNEMAESSKVGIEIAETDVPVRQEVRAVSELLGIDPLYIASEGRMVIFAESGYGNQILDILRTFPQCQDAALIGKAVDLHPGFVVEKTIFGGERIIDLLVGDPLPRIC